MRDTRRSAADLVQDGSERVAAEHRGPMSTGHRLWEWTGTFLVALGLFLLIRTFLVEAFRIPTGSMENTLLVGHFLLVNKAAFGPRFPFTRFRSAHAPDSYAFDPAAPRRAPWLTSIRWDRIGRRIH